MEALLFVQRGRSLEAGAPSHRSLHKCHQRDVYSTGSRDAKFIFSIPAAGTGLLVPAVTNSKKKSKLEMTMGMGLPLGIRIPWETQQNGRKTEPIVGMGMGKHGWE